MPLYIAPIVAGIQAILAKYMPDLLAAQGAGYPAFTEIGAEFTGIMPNPPQAWVMPVRTSIDDSGNSLFEAHKVTAKFVVTASDPEHIPPMAMAYMQAITDAIDMAAPSDWGGVIPNHVHVYEHDYGALYERGGVMARFPEAHIEIEVNELG